MLLGKKNDDQYKNKIKINSLFGNNFRGLYQIPKPDTPINGTLEGDYTGSFNFHLLRGVQPFSYFPENCLMAMLTAENLFRRKEPERIGNLF